MRDTTKADLEAARREVDNVMGENAVLKKENATAYQNGYRAGLQGAENLARIAQTQAGLTAYYINMLIGGIKAGSHQ